jgi:hypothetical protein
MEVWKEISKIQSKLLQLFEYLDEIRRDIRTNKNDIEGTLEVLSKIQEVCEEENEFKKKDCFK